EKFQPFVTKEVVVIQDGIHTELYDLPLRPVLKSQTVNLLMAGRLHPGKGQLDAVKAVELARQKTDRDLRLHILGTVGDPAYAEELHEYVESRGLDYVSIEDFVNDLSALREACDIGLTCSYSEGLGRVTIENMLASLLVIASDSGGTLEIVEDGKNGIFYKTGDPADLADKILWALDHPDECMPIIEEGHRFAKETYDCRTYTAKVQELYEQVLNNH
ncbi:MAG: glycosyltransferase family 4 protein, partial [Acutalibacteraceae bacterium]|nr:glycosyltransferase family 4 protein [Acutalibacteraceae bacterium]